MQTYLILALLLVLYVLGVVSGVALDHWIKRKGNVLSDVKSATAARVVSAETHVAVVAAAVKAAVDPSPAGKA